MPFTPQLRAILETSFLPLSCECTLMPEGDLIIEIFDLATGKVAMRLEHVGIEHITTVRAISELVAGLRYDLSTVVSPFGSAPAVLGIAGRIN